ncbi:hypothetical protein J2S00_001312 [Caldalkalibacillus uzonensis]|uniref:Uncharacterized protein n=1 Tax=Caldalkalibacillus uzonensis TaxID=353224 RepID=A0ABU0CQ50_9BACI|nr:hypothetical protein [Caldalkalibacillus uzonensis]MDQ0338526.1 hypothetical protein [Caldalkalibacillus uzonensis]
MRELTLEQIKERVQKRRVDVDNAVTKFRMRSKAQGWKMKRNRPRHPDETRVLDQIAKRMMDEARKSAKVEYDKESRVLKIDKLTRG